MSVHIKTDYINESGEVGKAFYADGQEALLFAPHTGEPAWALSTNLLGHGIIAPEGHVYVKDYSEHKGLCAQLVEAGVVEVVDEVIFGPYDTHAFLVRVNDDALFVG